MFPLQYSEPHIDRTSLAESRQQSTTDFQSLGPSKSSQSCGLGIGKAETYVGLVLLTTEAHELEQFKVLECVPQ